MGYIMPKPSLLKNSGDMLTPSRSEKGIDTIPTGMSSKRNAISNYIAGIFPASYSK